MKRLPSLDVLRCIAIILVLVFHYSILFPHPEWLEPYGKFGWTGVDLFFVLSGYLIASQLFQQIKETEKIDVTGFYVKRAFRILPIYFTILTAYFLFPVVREKEALPPLWKFLTFTQNLGLNPATSGTFSHAWSLCIEEQFYLVVPVVLLFLNPHKINRKIPFYLIALLGLSLVFRILMFNYKVVNQDGEVDGLAWYRLIYYPTYCRLDGISVGMLLAWMRIYKPDFIQKWNTKPIKAALIATAVIAFSFYICRDQLSIFASTLGFTLVAIGYGLLVAFSLQFKPDIKNRTLAAARWLADISYAAYLCHKIVFHLSQKLLSDNGIDETSTVVFVASITATLLVATALHLTIEKAAFKIRDRVLLRLSTSKSQWN